MGQTEKQDIFWHLEQARKNNSAENAEKVVETLAKLGSFTALATVAALHNDKDVRIYAMKECIGLAGNVHKIKQLANSIIDITPYNDIGGETVLEVERVLNHDNAFLIDVLKCAKSEPEENAALGSRENPAVGKVFSIMWGDPGRFKDEELLGIVNTPGTDELVKDEIVKMLEERDSRELRSSWNERYSDEELLGMVLKPEIKRTARIKIIGMLNENNPNQEYLWDHIKKSLDPREGVHLLLQ
ncbi:MAG: hypothetical protein PHS02_04165, partial [Candidatus ainarchaeum sp.]|nr:hypothetical protein [Candidatus ainarchaeum sp.]